MSDQHADTFTLELGYLAAGLTQSASTPAAAKWAIDRIAELRGELLSAIRQRDGLNAEVGATLNRLQMAHEELSAARAEIAELNKDAEANAWTVSPAMAQAKIDELNALLVTARAELAEYRTMHDGNLELIADLRGKVDSLRLSARDLPAELKRLRAELATARECLRDIEYDADGIPCTWPTREKRDKAAGMDSTSGEVKA